MTPPHRPLTERRRSAALLGVAGVLAGVLGVAAAAVVGLDEPDYARPVAAHRPVVPAAHRVALREPVRPDHALRGRLRAPARPVRIDIPAIDVHAPVVRVGLDRNGALQVPGFTETGWWKGGAKPGAAGPAVIVGHVDSTTGPAVLYRLRDVRRGDVISIMGADRRVVRFTVRHVAGYAKDRFPTERVYGPTRHPTLRLITCSGQFDRATGHYLDNTVVFASLAARR